MQFAYLRSSMSGKHKNEPVVFDQKEITDQNMKSPNYCRKI